MSGEWQPIKTAPKDGERVFLGWYRGEYWDCGVGCFVPGLISSTFDRWKREDGWFIDPTHWMPIPVAPPLDGGGRSA